MTVNTCIVKVNYILVYHTFNLSTLPYSSVLVTLAVGKDETPSFHMSAYFFIWSLRGVFLALRTAYIALHAQANETENDIIFCFCEFIKLF